MKTPIRNGATLAKSQSKVIPRFGQDRTRAPAQRRGRRFRQETARNDQALRGNRRDDETLARR